jgi:hypothetical protein
LIFVIIEVVDKGLQVLVVVQPSTWVVEGGVVHTTLFLANAPHLGMSDQVYSNS